MARRTRYDVSGSDGAGIDTLFAGGGSTCGTGNLRLLTIGASLETLEGASLADCSATAKSWSAFFLGFRFRRDMLVYLPLLC